MTATPAPAPTLNLTRSIPSSWPSFHDLGWNAHSNSVPIQLGRQLTVFLRAGFEYYGQDILLVVVPFMVAYTVLGFILDKVGVTMANLHRGQDEAYDLQTQILRAQGHRVSGGL